MTVHQEMPPARRRPIPGMASSAETTVLDAERPTSSPATNAKPRPGRSRGTQRRSPALGAEGEAAGRRPAVDYAATRLVNLRLPVDLHDRFKQLVREAEARHSRLRHPSLTELVIALLEEGPGDADEVAELIRRKRAAEHGAQP